ncbi:MAG: metalloregulator ArsR/SmtB family transcription factor [Betaproteobacteria bacterium]|nr:metalloregulator ArsR/SmtB family transcription factor [Betaproteobacteria bacterium]
MHHQFDTADFFSLLSDELRRRILVLLTSEQELCVCELFFALDAIQPKVSRHLALMRAAGVLSQRKLGRWVHYRVASQVPLWAHRILVSMADGVEDGRPYMEDRKRLRAMPNRPARSGTTIPLPVVKGGRSARTGIRA